MREHKRVQVTCSQQIKKYKNNKKGENNPYSYGNFYMYSFNRLLNKTLHIFFYPIVSLNLEMMQ